MGAPITGLFPVTTRKFGSWEFLADLIRGAMAFRVFRNVYHALCGSECQGDLRGSDGQLPPSDQEERPRTGQRWRGLDVCSVYPLGKDSATLLVICSGSVKDFEGDAIVNAANEGCITGGGVDGAITAAGGKELAEARLNLPILDHKRDVRCHVGDAKMTIGGRLKAQYCIHAVGPNYNILVYDQRMPMEECDKIVSKAYCSALECAKGKSVRNVAFSLISASIFRGPQTLEAVLGAGIEGIQGGMYPELREVALVAFTQKERTTLEMICGEKFPYAKGSLGQSGQSGQPSTGVGGTIQEEPTTQPLQNASRPDTQA